MSDGKLIELNWIECDAEVSKKHASKLIDSD